MDVKIDLSSEFGEARRQMGKPYFEKIVHLLLESFVMYVTGNLVLVKKKSQKKLSSTK